ncbi:MAG: Lin0512 family protein [Granulosicoccus sp.]
MRRMRLLTEIGMGTDLRGQDYTKAAIRGLKDALWHNSLTVAPALGYDREAMEVCVQVGVQEPEEVDVAAVAAVLPYGKAEVQVFKGGLDIVNDDASNVTVIANVAAVVYLMMDEEQPA